MTVAPLSPTSGCEILQDELPASAREDDGRWLAEVVELPGVLAYGATQEAAVSRVQALALRVIAERLAGNQAADRGRRSFLRLAGCGLGVVALSAGPMRARAQTTTAAPLKIGMVGAGRMGGALGALFVKARHPVMFSSRHPENLKDLTTRLGPLAQAGPVEQAVAFGDVVVMVVPYAALEEIGKAHGRVLATKPLVMDVCNPIARRDGADLVKWVGEQGGAGLASAKLLPGARIVRAFNGISYRRVAEIARRPGGLVGVPIAGDDPKAIGLAEGLIRGIGFEPVLVGGLAMGKHLLPGTPLAEEHTPAELRQIAAGLR